MKRDIELPHEDPGLFHREERLRMTVEAARYLIARGDRTGLFVGGAILAAIEDGGSIDAHLRLRERGSHMTVQRLWRRMSHRPMR